MLCINFYSEKLVEDIKELNVNDFEISEKGYEFLIKIGLEKITEYRLEKKIIEGEEYEINLTELNDNNRNKILELYKEKLLEENRKFFLTFNNESSIVESKEKISNLRELFLILEEFEKEEYKYFSYE